MSSPNHAEMRAIAERAVQTAPWRYEQYHRVWNCEGSPVCKPYGKTFGEQDAYGHHIATFDPPTVLALLDENATLRDRAEKAEAERDELVKESAALTKALTGLTANGSEFFIRKGDRYVADIAACVGWVEHSRQVAHDRTVKAILDRQAAESSLAAVQARVAELEGALKLALEYWAHRQQRYRNRAPVWVQQARALLHPERNSHAD